MVNNENTTYSNAVTSFIDLSRYFSDFTLTSWQYDSWLKSIYRYEGENPRLSRKVLHNVKPKVRCFNMKPLNNIRHTKQFVGHNFRIGKSKK